MVAMTNAERQKAFRQRQAALIYNQPPAPPRIALSNADRQRRFRELHGSSRGTLPFIGVDGEGAGTDNIGRQNFLLLRAGDRELFRNNEPLTTGDCCEFILGCPKNAILVGYFFGYDATMILRDVPPDRLKYLFMSRDERNANEIRSAYLFYDEYAIEFRPRQYFRVARLDKQSLRVYKGTARTINEVGGFFQKSFVEALRDWKIGSERQVAAIAEQKERRAEFTTITNIERRYCASECDLLEQLMERLRDTCTANNIVPASWRGAGALAARLHAINKTPRQSEQRRTKILDATAVEAYYGGRFEITTVGRIPGPVYEYDISSAYPAAMLRLPCPIHTRWRKLHAGQRADGLFVSKIHFKHSRDYPLGGFPVRAKGRLFWPLEAVGTYWSPEIDAARRADPGIAIAYHDGYAADLRCDCRAFDWVNRLYELRRSIGKSTEGYPIKLGLNALYGKLSQREGTAPYRDQLAAGLITAYTRAQLVDVYANDPGAVIMLATDAVFSRRPLPVDIGPQLGQWEEKIRDTGLFVVQPGIYWSPGSEHMPKTRGVPRSKIIEHRGAFEQTWNDWCRGDGRDEPPSVSVPITNFIGHRLALARNKPQLAGRWIIAPKAISFDWGSKRAKTGAADDGMVRTRPYRGRPDLRSQAYDPALLSELIEQGQLAEVDPDYIPLGNTVE